MNENQTDGNGASGLENAFFSVYFRPYRKPNMSRTIAECQAKSAIANLPGNYREVFFENSKGFSARMLNGKIEAPVSRSHEGFSILSRNGSDVRFASFPRLDAFESDVAEFCRSNGFSTPEFSSPSVPPELKTVPLEPGDPLTDAEPVFAVFGEIPSIAEKFSFLTSYEVVANFSYRSYAVATSKGSFGGDAQRYHSFYVILAGKRGEAHEEVMEKITGTDIL